MGPPGRLRLVFRVPAVVGGGANPPERGRLLWRGLFSCSPCFITLPHCRAFFFRGRHPLPFVPKPPDPKPLRLRLRRLPPIEFAANLSGGCADPVVPDLLWRLFTRIESVASLVRRWARCYFLHRIDVQHPRPTTRSEIPRDTQQCGSRRRGPPPAPFRDRRAQLSWPGADRAPERFPVWEAQQPRRRRGNPQTRKGNPTTQTDSQPEDRSQC